MEQLSKDWLTQGLIDLEYKKYILLAYLKTANESFNRNALYPFLADLVSHYRNIVSIKENKDILGEAFPKELSAEQFAKLEIGYRKLIADDATMAEIESIIEFAIPKIKSSLEDGSFIYEYVESKCEISPVGVTPIYAKEGYLFVTQPPEKETNVYRYQVSIFDGSQEQFRSLNTEFLECIEKKPLYTYERLKLDLVSKFKDLPNPATYLILSKAQFPFAETLMPVAKRLFVKHMFQ